MSGRNPDGTFAGGNKEAVGNRGGPGRPRKVRDADYDRVMREKWAAKFGDVCQVYLDKALGGSETACQYIIDRFLGKAVAQVAWGPLAEFQKFLEEMRAVEADERNAEGDV